jgi:hypothetical protein
MLTTVLSHVVVIVDKSEADETIPGGYEPEKRKAFCTFVLPSPLTRPSHSTVARPSDMEVRMNPCWLTLIRLQLPLAEALLQLDSLCRRRP